MIEERQLKPPAKDAKWCHRIYVPMTYAQQTGINPLTKEPIVEPKGNLIYSKCLGDQCSLWSEKFKVCGDLLSAESAKENLEMKIQESQQVKILNGSDLS